MTLTNGDHSRNLQYGRHVFGPRLHCAPFHTLGKLLDFLCVLPIKLRDPALELIPNGHQI
jgi:hypothetical protein